jgi:hypothetical protein
MAIERGDHVVLIGEPLGSLACWRTNRICQNVPRNGLDRDDSLEGDDRNRTGAVALSV